MRRFLPVFLLLIILIITFFTYKAGLSGGFVLDDGPTLINNASFRIHDLQADTLKRAAFSNDAGPLKRPISMLSFSLNYYATGINPYYFKLTNLIIHLLNGIGIFALTTLLFRIYQQRFQPALSAANTQWISLAVSSSWLLHPFNLTSVLYVTQRMTSLSAFFTIVGLVLFLRGRIQLYEGEKGWTSILIGLLIFTPLAIFSKENGALLPVFMLIAEITLFNFQTSNSGTRWFLVGFYILAIGIPFVAMLIYLAMHPGWLLAGYAHRDFTLSERLMTEARVLWFYLGQIILPSTTQMGLYHDDIAISHSLLQPVSTLLSVAGILALLTLPFLARKKAPLIAFGVLFFLTCHVLESTVFPFEIAYEHRNYLATYGIVLILFFYLLYPLRHLTNLRLRQGVAVLLIGVFAGSTFARSSAWANPYDFTKLEVGHHPESARANSEMADIYSDEYLQDPHNREMDYNLAVKHYEKNSQLDPQSTHGLFGLIKLNSASGKPIEARWRDELISRLEHQTAVDHGNQLVDLVNCQIAGTCKLSRNEI
jgi:hypothetical protein